MNDHRGKTSSAFCGLVRALLAAGFAGGLFGACSEADLSQTPGATEIVAEPVAASSVTWKGHTWTVTSGGMAGVAPGALTNVSVDASGFLHLKITKSGSSWTAAEMFTNDRLGFGTYQWQIDAPIDHLDRNVVLGLFPYGPIAGIGKDGTNEIDIEYSYWGDANGPNGDWTDYPASGSTIGELAYNFSLGGGTASTSRFIWKSTSIQDFLLSGYQPIGSLTGLIKTWTYTPSNPTTNIPQQALPLGMNLWCFGAPPSNGQGVEVIIRDFQFVPEGNPPPTQFTITASAGANGTINPSGAVGVAAGASQAFTIQPNRGYAIGSVSVDGKNVGAVPSYTFSNVQTAHSISSSFVSAGDAGTSVVQINAGGAAALPFLADAYYSGGTTITHANSIDRSAVTNPAPASVYQSGRVGAFTYTLPGFAAGSSHTLRLHFAETYFSSPGSRVFNVSINGAAVLNKFDIVQAAGAKNKANVQQFTKPANASGAYVIQFASVTNQSLVSGIEID
jgi:hypothetical protein